MTKFIFAQKPILLYIYVNTWKYNVCSIKLGIKVLHLHKIRVRIFNYFG